MSGLYVNELGWHELSKLADDENKITHYMCCICFEYTAIADLFVDFEGHKWDMCIDCGERESGAGI